MSNQNNKQELDEFIGEFNNALKSDSDKIMLPDSLRAESLFEKHNIKPEHKTIKLDAGSIKKSWMQFAASAACFVLIFAGYYNMTKLGTLKATPQDGIDNGNITSENQDGKVGSRVASPKVSPTANYTQVRDAISKLYLRQDELGKEQGTGAVPTAPSAEKNTMDTGFGMAGMADSFGGVYTTNTQIAGIDEADIVKTDGKYIYHYRFDDQSGKSEVAIVSAVNLELASKISLGEYNQAELYIYDNNLVVIDTVPTSVANQISDNLTISLGEAAPTGIKSKGSSAEGSPAKGVYDSAIVAPGFIGDSYKRFPQNTMTRAVVYDVSDKTSPDMVNSLVQDGSYVSSRLDGERLYLLTNKSSSWGAPIDSMPARDVIPYTNYNGKVGLIPPEDIIISPYMQSANYAVVSSLNLKNKKTTTKAILGMSDKMMMSTENLFLTSNISEYNSKGEYSTATGIAKFALNKGSLDYISGTSVKGYIDNQFSLDEHKGNLRIATTSFALGETQNNLYVLDEKLNTIGSLENLAPGEKIYSARFMGNTGYIVTFKQVDPLFVIDLSNPKNPTVKGELKIPGFSEYLHPMGNGKLLGFGVNTIANQNGGVVQDGLKLSMFNVLDPNNPTEDFKLEIGNMGTYSEVLDNHKAFMYYPQKNLIGFPANIYTSSGGVTGNPWAGERNNTFSGYLVYEVKTDGFKLAGKIPSNDKIDDTGRFQPSNIINRGVYIGDVLYTISNGKLMAYNLSNFSKTDELLYK